MSRIVLIDEQRSRLDGVRDATEVVDLSGNLVGHFLDATSYVKYLDNWEKEHAEEFAELDRRASDGDVGTLDELWKELGVQ
jgi:hypothetical protein